MKKYFLLLSLVVAGCADNLVDRQAAMNIEAFNRTIPDDWNASNYKDRVFQDYASKGAIGYFSIDLTGTIASFYNCSNISEKECNKIGEKEANALCENQIALGIYFKLIPEQEIECNIIFKDDVYVGNGIVTLGGKFFNKGTRI